MGVKKLPDGETAATIVDVERTLRAMGIAAPENSAAAAAHLPGPGPAAILAGVDATRGDLAIIHYNTDVVNGVQGDTISFVLLNDIAAGTTIFFTDRSWNGTSLVSGAGDGTFTYTTGASAVAAGTVITITSAQLLAAGIDLSDAGDTIYAYQGAINAPTEFLYAADIADGNTIFNGSLVNTGLVAGTSAVAVAGDNASFADHGHNIQLPDLLQSIGSATNWATSNDAPVAPYSGNFFGAPDQNIWVATAGDAGLQQLARDGTDTATQQTTLYQDLNNPTTAFNHPNDIVFDTVHGLYFVADSDTGNRRILQGNISDLFNPGATPTLKVLWTDQSAGTAGGQINGLAIDVDAGGGAGALYFVNQKNFEKISYSHDGNSGLNQTASVLANLGATDFANEVALDLAHNRAFVVSTASSTAAIEVPAGTPGAIFDPDSGTYYIIGTTASNNEIYQVGGLDRTDTSTAQTTLTKLDLNGAAAGTDFASNLGLIQSVDVDTTTGLVYFTSIQLNLGVSGETGGVFRINPVGGAVETLYSEGNATDYGFEYIDVDPVSGRYYVSNVSFESPGNINGTSINTSSIMWHGLSAGTPLLFGYAGNANGDAPQGLIVNNAPTMTSTGQATAVTETAVANSGASNLVQPIATIDVTDGDTAGQTDQLGGAQVRVSSNFLSGAGHQDLLTINGLTSGTLDFGAQDITFSYNSSTGVLTLSGASTFNNYEAALLLVRYSVSGDNPTNYGTAGSRTISWSVTDGLSDSDETSATVSVTGVNDAPIDVVPAGQSLAEDASKVFSAANSNAISVSDADADPATQALSVTLTVGHGTLSLSGIAGLSFTSGDGTGDATMIFTGTANAINAALSGLTYTSTLDYFGSDTLTLTTNDQGFGGTDPNLTGTATSEQDSDTVAITITAVADIVNDTPTIAEDAGITTINVLANDTFENSNRAITAVGTASHGTVTINDNGTVGVLTDDFIQYTANADYNGTDSFTYTVTSGGAIETATVTVTVTAVADIAADSVTVDEDSGTTVLNLLGNDTFESSARAITAVGLAAHGIVAINNNGTAGDATDDFVTYTPTGDYNGPDSFTYTVTSGGVTETATVSVTVNSVNDAPAGTDGSTIILEDGSYTFTASDFGFTDTDGNAPLSVIVTTVPAGGSLIYDDGVNPVTTLSAGAEILFADIQSGFLTFVPVADGNGASSFTFQVRDNGGIALGGVDTDQSANTFTINVTAVDDAPTAVADTLTVAANLAAAIAVVANDTDIDGGPKAVASVEGTLLTAGNSVTLASGATVTLNLDGTLSYDANGAFDYLVSAATAAKTGASDSQATDIFTYALNGGSAATVTVTVNGVDGPGDELRGTGGNDFIRISGNPVLIDGLGGYDTLVVAGHQLFAPADGEIANFERILVRGGSEIDLSAVLTPVGLLRSTSLVGEVVHITGTRGADQIYGGAGADVLSGGDGNDRIFISATPGHVDGGTGNDLLVIEEGANITLTNASFTNFEQVRVDDGAKLDLSGVTTFVQAIHLNSTAGGGAEAIGTTMRDNIVGGDGNDMVTGGRGSDLQTGGLGDDTFVFKTVHDFGAGALDRISDFTTGEDKIDLSAIDPDSHTGGDQAFTFIGNSAFTGAGGTGYELRFESAGGGNLLVQGDINHDGAADFSFVVHAPTLVATDFTL